MCPEEEVRFHARSSLRTATLAGYWMELDFPATLLGARRLSRGVRAVFLLPDSSLPVPTPSAAESEALATVAAYLARAGNHAATLLLDERTIPGDAALLHALRDSLLAGAALCDGMRDLPRIDGG